MVVPTVGTGSAANKGLFLLQQAGLRHRYLRERIPVRVAHDLATREDSKYFFVKVKHKRLDGIRGKVNTLLQQMAGHLTGASCPARVDLDAFLDGRPMGLFEIARLHAAFSSDALDGTPADDILSDFGLRVGIPEKSIVPALRVFDPSAFDRLQAKIGGVAAVAEQMCAITERDSKNIQLGLMNLRGGYAWRNGDSRYQNRGRYRISTRYASVIHQACLNLAADPAMVPSFDALFSHHHEHHPVGTRLGTRPLERSEGAIY